MALKASRMSEFLMANEGQVKSRSLKDEKADCQDDTDKQTYDEIERNSDLVTSIN